MPKHQKYIALVGLAGMMLLGARLYGSALIADLSDVPSCNGSTATIYVSSANVIVGGPDDGETYAGTLNGTSGTDVIAGTESSDVINGKNGDDVICGKGGADVIGGDYGNDTLFGEGGNDTIDGNQDDDQMDGGEGDDVLNGGYGADTIRGGNGSDTIEGNQDTDRLFGDAGNDSLDGGYGADTLCGNGDDDSISGRQNDDEIDGGPGTDTIDGNAGTDICRNGESNTDCEDAAAGFIVACGDAGASSSAASSEQNSSAPPSSGGASSVDSSATSTGNSQSAGASSTGTSGGTSAVSSAVSSQTSTAAAGDTTQWNAGTPSTAQPQSGGGGGGGVPKEAQPLFRGHGLAEHASALDFILSNYDLQPRTVYSFSDQNAVPAPILSVDTERTVRMHGAICSMYRYFKQLIIARPNTPDDYVDWVAGKMADALGEDPVRMKAALLGHPHTHAGHVDDIHLQNISEHGCAANEYVYEALGHGAGQDGTTPLVHLHLDQSHLMETITTPEALRVDDRSTEAEITFSILRGNELFTDYGNSLTKEMHLIIVRDDLTSFYHVHPDRDAFGMWHIPFTPQTPGNYWLYANFSERDGHAYALRFPRTYGNAAAVSGTGTTFDFATQKSIDGYDVQLIPQETDTGTSFTYRIRDAEGKRVRPEHFMGAFGHSVILSTEGHFVHSHPSLRVNDDPVFFVEELPPGTYRIFAQFVIDETEHTFVFDWMR